MKILVIRNSLGEVTGMIAKDASKLFGDMVTEPEYRLGNLSTGAPAVFRKECDTVSCISQTTGSDLLACIYIKPGYSAALEDDGGKGKENLPFDIPVKKPAPSKEELKAMMRMLGSKPAPPEDKSAEDLVETMLDEDENP